MFWFQCSWDKNLEFPQVISQLHQENSVQAYSAFVSLNCISLLVSCAKNSISISDISIWKLSKNKAVFTALCLAAEGLETLVFLPLDPEEEEVVPDQESPQRCLIAHFWIIHWNQVEGVCVADWDVWLSKAPGDWGRHVPATYVRKDGWVASYSNSLLLLGGWGGGSELSSSEDILRSADVLNWIPLVSHTDCTRACIWVPIVFTCDNKVSDCKTEPGDTFFLIEMLVYSIFHLEPFTFSLNCWFLISNSQWNPGILPCQHRSTICGERVTIGYIIHGETIHGLLTSPFCFLVLF